MGTRRIEIYDTTLRDGTQGEGFNLSLNDKLLITQKLDELGMWGKVPVLFSPSYGQVAPQDLAQWVLESGKPARLQVQLHKILWGEKRGV